MKSILRGRMVVLFCAMVSSLHLAKAQSGPYTGGSGRGDASRSTGTVFMNGVSYFVTYAGGSGRGDGLRQTSLLNMNGTAWAPTYAGGSGRGDSKDISTFSFLNGDEVDVKFRGGAGRGDRVATSAAMQLNGTIYSVLYAGGAGDGSDFIGRAASLLNGGEYTLQYPGGQGDGNSSARSPQIFINGSPYVALFTGGSGRGDVFKKSNALFLNGSAAPPFARVAFASQALDFRIVRNSNKSSSLTWKADPHTSASIYHVETSTNGADFSTVGILAEGDANGSFAFSTNDLSIGTHHFRIRRTSPDGSEDLSRIQTIDISDSDDWLQVFPNPATSTINIQHSRFQAFASEVYLTDATGRVVAHLQAAAGEPLQLSLQSIPSGIYWVSVSAGDMKKQLRIVKQ